VYGGVQADYETAREAGANTSQTLSAGEQFFGTLLPTVDMPFSAVGDTLTLPVTMPLAAWSSVKARQQVQAAPAAASTAKVSLDCVDVEDPSGETLGSP
jgi:uncharacterized protein YceK